MRRWRLYLANDDVLKQVDAFFQMELGLIDDRATESARDFARRMYPWWVAIGIHPSERLNEWCENEKLEMFDT